MPALTLALSKGRIFDETLPLLGASGIVPTEDPEASRRLITGDVYDAHIGRVERTRLLYEPGPADPLPRVESARVILDHVGLIDGEYRTFSDINVHRVWRLQRLNGGPWKITEVQRL